MIPQDLTLISKKPIQDFTPEEYHRYISSLRAEPERKIPKSPAPGLSVKRTKTGLISITRNKKTRALAYVTASEVEALAKAGGFTQNELWKAFKDKAFWITQTKAEAERIATNIAEIPW